MGLLPCRQHLSEPPGLSIFIQPNRRPFVSRIAPCAPPALRECIRQTGGTGTIATRGTESEQDAQREQREQPGKLLQTPGTVHGSPRSALPRKRRRDSPGCHLQFSRAWILVSTRTVPATGVGRFSCFQTCRVIGLCGPGQARNGGKHRGLRPLHDTDNLLTVFSLERTCESGRKDPEHQTEQRECGLLDVSPTFQEESRNFGSKYFSYPASRERADSSKPLLPSKSNALRVASYHLLVPNSAIQLVSSIHCFQAGSGANSFSSMLVIGFQEGIPRYLLHSSVSTESRCTWLG